MSDNHTTDTIKIIQGYEPKSTNTIFIDIDGTILYHMQDIFGMLYYSPIILPNVLKKFKEWQDNGDVVIITSARPEKSRERTIEQLEQVGLKKGIMYQDLLLGVTYGKRIIINDEKPETKNTAEAFVIERNKGLGDLKC